MNTSTDEKFVIIGASAAGITAADEIRKLDQNAAITMISKEEVKGYYRPRLSEMLSNDKISAEQITFKNDQWYADRKINLLLNQTVRGIDPVTKQVSLEDGTDIPYTKLIIASGAEVFVPPFSGRDKEGVFTLRHLKDMQNIKEYAKGKKNAVVIGGGLLGLEAANGLKGLGLNVSVLEHNKRILPRQLDPEASSLLEEKVDKYGIKFLKNASTKEIVGTDKLEGILLESGETIAADLLIISTGVNPNTAFAKGTDLEIKRAIVVNEKMETSLADIYAAGDCAEFNGINYALWIEAVEQGKTAGINAAGGEYLFETFTPFTSLQAFDTKVFSIGDVGSKPEREYDTYKNYDDGNFRELYFADDKLCGAILIGDTSKQSMISKAFKTGISKNDMLEKFES
ncbi:MAG: NAD(P)/FAD-dependent oxidoreductase [Clostridiaceae bacterium]|jgi:NAD(P)H-nitrite reductase large subunit|nr:NAD(P)/FAD-dependent oxidoreductase [Clostridiaceae bacterium]